MMIRKINNVPSNIKAFVVGATKEDQDKAGKFSLFIFLSVIAGTIYLNYKYNTGKI